MTPEEKLLALIQQDKRQANNVTPQEKLLALIEQDKSKPESAAPVSSPTPVVVKAAPASVKPVLPVIAPAPAPAPAVTSFVSDVATPVKGVAPVAPLAPAPVKTSAARTEPLALAPRGASELVGVGGGSSPSVKTAEALKGSASEDDKPVAPVSGKSVVLASSYASAILPALARPMRGSPMTMMNRGLAAVAALLVLAVFYSVAGTQRGINEEVRRQLSSAGEMSVVPVAIVEEPVSTAEALVDRVSGRNYFSPIVTEKTSAGGGAATAVVGALKDLKLVAVSVDAATPSDSMGIIKNKADSKTYFVKIGETVGDTGMTLLKVLGDRLILKQGKQEFELK